MVHEVKAPSVGESVSEVSILKWAKGDGDIVSAGDLILEIESDKATVEIVAEHSGALKILKPQGEKVPVGYVIGTIDDTAKASAAPQKSAPTPAATPVASAPKNGATPQHSAQPLSPSVRKLIQETGVDPSQIHGTGKGGRITAQDVSQHQARGPSTPTPSTPVYTPSPTTPSQAGERRVPMSSLRARIAERLLQAQQNAAILTTFNECDMSAVMALRNQHKDAFKAKHGVPLSFMSFFTRASVLALQAIPEVNAFIDGNEIVYHDFCNVGIAVGTERGLVVPVIRSAEQMGFVEIEKATGAFAEKARNGKLGIADMSGGTFTISNGGVYGSLMSTPILNPPQSGILGMHKIMERPIVVNGKVEVKPMMYLALSYDHRIIDGKGAVTFLVKLKETIENPDLLGFNY